ncbi:FAD-binding oxidoreductase, partial [Sediminivirga luteola]|uniref:FAD-binding oxidoreductase n=1 Tax=Sediminivirga luteola TaxID=1774748 RepID=UPI001F590384
GGANAVPGCILLNVSRMNRILHVDAAERTATVEPGVINQDLKDHLAGYGLAYPPDPGSVAISSIGGNIATNAGGLCCVKYGVTRDYVRSLKVVLADGSLTRLGARTAKGVAGLDLRGLFIGSEGTLGVVVEATVRLVPALPDPLTAIAVFGAELDAIRTVTAVMSSGLQPSMLEFMDAQTIYQLNELGDFGLDPEAGAILLMQADDAHAAAQLERFTGLAEQHGATEVVYSDDPEDSEALIHIRRQVSAAAELFAARNGGGDLVEDLCVPVTALPEFYAGVAAVRREYDVVISCAGHAGDGNLHPGIFFDAADPDAVRRADAAFDALMALGLELGGTITGEHGVGHLKNRWLARELDDSARALHRQVKQALDPRGILNPGKMLAAL